MKIQFSIQNVEQNTELIPFARTSWSKRGKVIFGVMDLPLSFKKFPVEVRQIHARLEPAKKARKQGHFDPSYEKSPIVSARLDSNQGPRRYKLLALTN